MTSDRSYFFCGVGGSGMMPLALILKQSGASVAGSDRAHDAGRMPDKFAFLRAHGVDLHAQDGSGVRDGSQILVVSAAVEDQVPDVQAARRVGAQITTRAQLLAQLFNAAPVSIGVAGTSGKSTTTGMIGWILESAGRAPTIMNGAVMKNFVTPDALFASSKVGAGRYFVSEVDESDGSIALYRPRIGVLNNIALDHKSMDELRALFRAFLIGSERAVLNLDNHEAASAAGLGNVSTYSLLRPDCDLFGFDLSPAPAGIAFSVQSHSRPPLRVALQTPGRHNVENALGALCAAGLAGVPLEEAARALEGFLGLRRRLELVGVSRGISVFDDFAHNPDKIKASLTTLHAFAGRCIILFQPHGFRPLTLMKNELADAFASNMSDEDVLIMPEPIYFGGTVDRSASSADLVDRVKAKGRSAMAVADREMARAPILSLAREGDRIIIMGARDDTLSTFASQILADLRDDDERRSPGSPAQS